MKNLALLMIAASILGCATEAPRIDQYSYVAYSWTGGNIGDMIEAWGTPKKGYEQATVDQPGYARWRVWSRFGRWETGGGIRHHCETVAVFGMDGTITEIEIRASVHCERYYKDLDSMLRPGVKPLPDTT